MAKSALNVAVDMKVSLEDELPVILLREYEFESHVKGYHFYNNSWEPAIGERFKARCEPENEYEKFAVAVESSGKVVGIYRKANLVDLPRQFHSFCLRTTHTIAISKYREKVQPWQWTRTSNTLHVDFQWTGKIH